MGKLRNESLPPSQISDLTGVMRYSHLLTNAIPRSQHLRFVRIARAGNGLSTLVTAKNEVHDTVKKSTSTQIVIGYVIAALGGMALIAHYKEDKDFDPKVRKGSIEKVGC